MKTNFGGKTYMTGHEGAHCPSRKAKTKINHLNQETDAPKGASKEAYKGKKTNSNSTSISSSLRPLVGWEFWKEQRRSWSTSIRLQIQGLVTLARRELSLLEVCLHKRVFGVQE